MSSLISIRDLHKVYHSGRASEIHALRGVDLTFEEGEFVMIMGSSGCGKSTLMNIIGCLDRPTRGSYQLDGEEVATMDRNARADMRSRKIGFVFQGFHLLARTSALENVELPLLYNRDHPSYGEMKRRATEALELVGLGDRISHTPNELSGGQQQRVAIARALVNHPRVLIADEPTGNLDSRTTLDILTLLQRLNDDEGLTIVMVTHEAEVYPYGKRLVRMKDGRVIADGPIQDRRSARQDRATAGEELGDDEDSNAPDTAEKSGEVGKDPNSAAALLEEEVKS